MDSTLVLNTDMQPVNILPLSTITWQEAITKTWDHSVSVIEEYSTITMRSPSISMKLPSVVMLNQYQVNRATVRYSRQGVFLRDMYTCQYCGKELFEHQHELTIDHFIPRCRGGATSWSNSITACQRCNAFKSHHNHVHPTYKPYKPDFWELCKKRRQLPIHVPHESWIPYIGWYDLSLVKIK